jgi:hypothetical protein
MVIIPYEAAQDSEKSPSSKENVLLDILTLYSVPLNLLQTVCLV